MGLRGGGSKLYRHVFVMYDKEAYILHRCVNVMYFIRLYRSIITNDYLDRVKRKSAFEYVQNVQIQIIVRMRKVSLLSNHTFCSFQ